MYARYTVYSCVGACECVCFCVSIYEPCDEPATCPGCAFAPLALGQWSVLYVMQFYGMMRLVRYVWNLKFMLGSSKFDFADKFKARKSVIFINSCNLKHYETT